jgi:hypothetical protein
MGDTSGSDNSVTYNKIGRPPKAEKYIKERHETLNKINKILGITDTNNKFYLCDITEEKQSQILSMKDDIKVYFNCSYDRVFKFGVKKEYIALIKLIFKYMNISLICSRKTVERNNKKISTSLYFTENTLA